MAKISDRPTNSALDDADLIPIVQETITPGVKETRVVTLGDLGAHFGTGGGGGGSSAISTITGTTYTGAAADNGKTLVFTNASAKSATIDPDATTALPADWELIINNKGASNLTVIAGSGVTITAPAGGTLVIPAGGTAAIKRRGTDDFFLAGNTL